MTAERLVLLYLAVATIAFLYSAVGHAGASGYLAVLTLFGFAAAVIRPTSLLLNLMVATLATIQFARAGHFSWRLFWPFAVLSVPAAFWGGRIPISPAVFKVVVGVVLLVSAARFFVQTEDPDQVKAPSRPVAIAVGGVLGLIAGLTATGGGIFLTPVMLLARWARTRNTAAVSAPFILVNSISGLVGFVSKGQPLPMLAWQLALVVVPAGLLGSHLGSRRFPVRTIRLLLAIVLTIAGTKLVLGG